MNDDYDYPSFDDHFHGLEEEIHSDEANKLTICPECGDICHSENLHDGVCEDCWDDLKQQTDEILEEIEQEDAALRKASHDEANKLTTCSECGDVCHPDNLHDGVCEDCWDDEADEPYEDDVWADADTLAGAGYGTDEDYGYYGEE